jgi:hypothetical protein
MTQVSKELIVPFLETKVATKVLSLSDKQTPLLMQSGLVKGIIPMSMRQRSNQLMLDTVIR